MKIEYETPCNIDKRNKIVFEKDSKQDCVLVTIKNKKHTMCVEINSEQFVIITTIINGMKESEKDSRSNKTNEE